MARFWMFKRRFSSRLLLTLAIMSLFVSYLPFGTFTKNVAASYNCVRYDVHFFQQFEFNAFDGSLQVVYRSNQSLNVWYADQQDRYLQLLLSGPLIFTQPEYGLTRKLIVTNPTVFSDYVTIESCASATSLNDLLTAVAQNGSTVQPTVRATSAAATSTPYYLGTSIAEYNATQTVVAGSPTVFTIGTQSAQTTTAQAGATATVRAGQTAQAGITATIYQAQTSVARTATAQAPFNTPTMRPGTAVPTARPATAVPTARPGTAVPTARPATAVPATAVPTARPATATVRVPTVAPTVTPYRSPAPVATPTPGYLNATFTPAPAPTSSVQQSCTNDEVKASHNNVQAPASGRFSSWRNQDYITVVGRTSPYLKVDLYSGGRLVGWVGYGEKFYINVSAYSSVTMKLAGADDYISGASVQVQVCQDTTSAPPPPTIAPTYDPRPYNTSVAQTAAVVQQTARVIQTATAAVYNTAWAQAAGTAQAAATATELVLRDQDYQTSVAATNSVIYPTLTAAIATFNRDSTVVAGAIATNTAFAQAATNVAGATATINALAYQTQVADHQTQIAEQQQYSTAQVSYWATVYAGWYEQATAGAVAAQQTRVAELTPTSYTSVYATGQAIATQLAQTSVAQGTPIGWSATGVAQATSRAEATAQQATRLAEATIQQVTSVSVATDIALTQIAATAAALTSVAQGTVAPDVAATAAVAATGSALTSVAQTALAATSVAATFAVRQTPLVIIPQTPAGIFASPVSASAVAANMTTAVAAVCAKEPCASVVTTMGGISDLLDMLRANSVAPPCTSVHFNIPTGLFSFSNDAVDRGFCGFIDYTTFIRYLLRMFSMCMFGLTFYRYMITTIRAVGDV